MPETPTAIGLLQRVQARMRIRSLASAAFVSSIVVLVLGICAVLAMRLLGLVSRSQEQAWWLLAIPAVAALGAALFHRRAQQTAAAHAIDEHADTKDLFLTLSSLNTSAGDYQPLVAQAAEQRASSIEPTSIVPFRPWKRVARVAGVAGLFALALWQTPQLDPFGRVEAVEQKEQQKKDIQAILKANDDRRENLKKKSRHADEMSEEIEGQVTQLKKDFREMRPKAAESNTKVLNEHRSTLGNQWKAQSSEQLRKMLNQPISRQQMGGNRSKKMNEWLKGLQEGNTESLQKELQKAQETMKAMMEAKDPEEREKLAEQLKKDLQDLKKFSSDKAGSKELASALSKALKALEASRPSDKKPGEPMDRDAMEALKESLELSQEELEQVAQAAKDLKKLEEALKTLQQAQQLNQDGQMDGEKLEGCETMADYAEMYAQMMGEGGGPKDRNEGGGGGAGEGGETPEDDSDSEGYKDEKSKTRIKAGKILLSIKTKEHAEDKDFDPDALRQYQDSVGSLKKSVQSAIENEEIPPGYVDGIKEYFDRIEDVDPDLKPAKTE